MSSLDEGVSHLGLWEVMSLVEQPLHQISCACFSLGIVREQKCASEQERWKTLDNMCGNQ